jgi:glutaminase
MPKTDRDNYVWQQTNELHQRYLALGYEDVDSYYPPEMEEERHRFGLAYTNVDGTAYYVGDWDYAFPLHSISKVFLYAVALEDNGRDETLQRVGVQPTGEGFSSFTFDEPNNRPFNPMINAGAIVTANLVEGKDRDEKVERVVERLRLYAGNPDLAVDQETLDAELVANDRNLGLSYLMRSMGMISGDVAENLAVYLSVCSVKVNSSELATMGATLANGGVNPVTGRQALEKTHVRDVLTVMAMCGMYDAAGEWAYDVGLPAKSSVSGGILVAMPERFGAAFFSPGLDVHGNSARGVAICRALSKHYGLHVFADPTEDRLGLVRDAVPTSHD